MPACALSASVDGSSAGTAGITGAAGARGTARGITTAAGGGTASSGSAGAGRTDATGASATGARSIDRGLVSASSRTRLPSGGSTSGGAVLAVAAVRNCSRAARKSLAVWKRSLGRTASARRIAGTRPSGIEAQPPFSTGSAPMRSRAIGGAWPAIIR